QRETRAAAAPAGPKANRRAARATEAAEAVAETSEPRFGALKGMLSRRAEATPRDSEAIIEDAEQERESLFDRALASIDALEVMPSGSTAAGARARASYGAARPAARSATRPAAAAGGSRENQIAELQRAIEAARKSAS
ncbi:MAG: hypothetical protein KC458_12260, partial [Dehalococcoidia bacterium]|nr:hypothetical protein [Dehalococcoidia bacterium]